MLALKFAIYYRAASLSSQASSVDVWAEESLTRASVHALTQCGLTMLVFPGCQATMRALSFNLPDSTGDTALFCVLVSCLLSLQRDDIVYYIYIIIQLMQ